MSRNGSANRRGVTWFTGRNFVGVSDLGAGVMAFAEVDGDKMLAKAYHLDHLACCKATGPRDVVREAPVPLLAKERKAALRKLAADALAESRGA